ncbi:hypothetical protein BLOT_009808 [Blomia tropicalis]|nr:hypothetical protein BLOT_009808 [Blomia tropicalis]
MLGYESMKNDDDKLKSMAGISNDVFKISPYQAQAWNNIFCGWDHVWYSSHVWFRGLQPEAQTVPGCRILRMFENEA